MIEMEFDMDKPTRRRLGKTKGKPFTREYLTQKERWGEITVTHITPTKPDLVMPERVVIKPKKPKRDPRLPIPEILPGVQNWNHVAPKTRRVWEHNAERALARDQKKNHLK